jgi:hypothetical protein
MEELNPSFTTATNCEAFKLTSKMLEEILEKAKVEGREYAWTPLSDDYWLAEKTDFDYEIACPNFFVLKSDNIQSISCSVEVHGLFESYQGHQNLHLAFAKVFQIKGQENLAELLDVARMYSYMRFCLRDHYRDYDQRWWSDFLSSKVVSNETTLIFTEDKSAAHTWAYQAFPNNSLNAWIGKCGEFIFSTWAGECGLSVSRVDLKDHPEGDEYDFIHNTLLTKKDGNTLKLDIKAFQLEDQQKRKHWNVNQRCLVGDHRQDAIIFVVIDENFRLGKVVGYLPPDEILENSEYISSNMDYSSNSRGYYRVYLEDIHNPYYLRALLDSRNQFFNGVFFGVKPSKAIKQMIKDYPLDPITAYYSEYDYQHPIRGGLSNLTAKPTLKLFVNPYYY